MGIDRIIRGVLKYRQLEKASMVEQFKRVRDNPQNGQPEEVDCNYPRSLMFSCVDSRMLPTKFTNAQVGEMYLVRNVGNLVPHCKHYDYRMTTTEPAALELGCLAANVKHVVVCGHSDCKAMNLLYSLRDTSQYTEYELYKSPLRSWLLRHAKDTLEKFEKLEKMGYQVPLLFQGEVPNRKFVAYIDPDNRFNTLDKLSQVNTLQQLQNIASYNFLKQHLHEGRAHVHAIWFDIYTGDVYYFSRQRKIFVEINEANADKLFEEVEMIYT